MEDGGVVVAPWSVRISMVGMQVLMEYIEELYAGRTDIKSG